MTRSIPGPRGFANLRWSTRLARDIYGTLLAIHDQFGAVATVGFGRYRAVYLFGAEANNALFAQGAGTVSWHDVMKSLIPVDGATAIVVSDGADHERRRRVVQPAFARRKLDATIALMHEEARQTFSGWSAGSRHDAYVELRPCVRRIVIRALFGDGLGANADEFGDRLEDAFTYISRPPWMRFDRDWPGTAYRRAMRARGAADAIVYGEIAHRRASDDASRRDDLLSALVNAHDSDGVLSDVELRDQVVSLIAAGYDTTSAAAAWMIQFLAARPDDARRLAAEVRDVAGDDIITAEAIARMPWLNGVVSESLRLGSPAYVGGRRIEAAFDVLDFTLPAGPLVFYSPYVTHRMETLWPAPLEFRPGRWIEGHEYHHEILAGAWVPFGGGARRCLGFSFAITELKILAIELVRRTNGHITAERPTMPPAGFVSMRPAGEVGVIVAT